MTFSPCDDPINVRTRLAVNVAGLELLLLDSTATENTTAVIASGTVFIIFDRTDRGVNFGVS